MKNIFYIESEKFLRDMLEFAFKAEGMSCYTMEDAKDPFYLIKDLSTETIIIDIETVLEDLESFFKGLESEGLSDILLLATGSDESFEKLGSYKSKVSKLINKPISAKEVVKLLKSYS